MIEVRPARAQELAGVGALTVAAYASDGHVVEDDGYRVTLSDAVARAEHAELWVAADGESVLGTVTVAAAGTRFAEVARPGELEFRMLATAPEARHRGVGTELVLAVLAAAAARRCCAVVISTQVRMRAAGRLYERLGFVPAPERDWQPVPGLWLRVLRRSASEGSASAVSAAPGAPTDREPAHRSRAREA